MKTLIENHHYRVFIALHLFAILLLATGCESVQRGSIVSTHSPHPSAATNQPLTRSARQSNIRTVILGYSVKGVPLKMEIFGNGPDRVLIFGGIHGSEPTSAVLARELANRLRINWQLFEGKTVAVFPEANPDGLTAGRRTNSRGVDLNRNFPAKNWKHVHSNNLSNGTKPASEPETQAIITAIEMIKPDRIVSIHSIRRGRHCNNFDGPAHSLAQLMSSYNHYPVKPTMGYPTPGSFGSWAGIDRQIPTITLELPREQSGAKCCLENIDALKAFIRSTGK